MVVDEGDQAGRSLAIKASVVQLAGELTAAAAVDENAFDRLAHRKEESRVERPGVLHMAGQGVVIVGEVFAEENEVALAEGGGVFADVIGPFYDQVKFHMLDGIDAEPITVGGINQVFEGLGDPVSDVVTSRFQIIRSPELAEDILGVSVPVVDRAVVMEMGEFIEWIGMPAVPPPAEGVVAIRPKSLVVVGVVAEQTVEIGGVVDDHVQDDVDAAGMTGVD